MESWKAKTQTLLTKDEFGKRRRSFAPFVLPSSNRSLLVGQYVLVLDPLFLSLPRSLPRTTTM